MSELTEVEIELAARISNLEYLLRLVMANQLRNFPDPLATARDVRARTLKRVRFAATTAPDANPDAAFRVQSATASAMERWFDELERLLRTG